MDTITQMDGVAGPPAQVLLISMPFGPLYSPSIGLSLLKAGLEQRGIATQIRYLTLEFALAVGIDLYNRIASGAPATQDLVGEWIFSNALYDRSAARRREYLDQIVRPRLKRMNAARQNCVDVNANNFVEGLEHAASLVPAYLDEAATELLQAKPCVIGFTSVFQQHMASLALAQRLKRLAPGLKICFGGANCEGAMGEELARRFPFIDHIISGEADITFPGLVADMIGCGDPAVASGQGDPRFISGVRPANLDDVPLVSYRDYFQQVQNTGLEISGHLRILFETARGCWWGEKHHCTFCGLNGDSMAFRSKTPERALVELQRLAADHPAVPISVVDNIIDMKYFKNFLPLVQKLQLSSEIFYEVKANLTKKQVKQLRDSGVTTIQPGIESLSDSILSLMRKGVRALQNVQLLKWCKQYGVKPEWNLLWGFPREPCDEYARMAALVPLLTHLQPPGGMANIRMDRFSPNFSDALRLGFTDIRAAPSYHHIYDLPDEAIQNLAYYFEFSYAVPQEVAVYVEPLRAAVVGWMNEFEASDLFYIDDNGFLAVWDFRKCAVRPLTLLSGFERACYLACDQMRTTGQIRSLLAEDFEIHASLEDVVALLKRFVAASLVIADQRQFLGLAVELGPYEPGSRVLERMLEFAAGHGYRDEFGNTSIRQSSEWTLAS